MPIKRAACTLITFVLILFISACTDTGTDQAKTSLPDRQTPARQPAEKPEAGQQTESGGELVEPNSLPALTAARLLADFEGDRSVLRAEAEGVDEDNDEVTFEYSWERNGRIDPEKGAVLRNVKRGDKVALTVQPFDGKEYGAETTLRTEVANTPPTIRQDDQFTFDSTVFSKKISAADADGDTLTFALEKGPEGMKIDASSGMLSWTVPADLTGDIDARVSVSDGQGGKVFYDIVIPISVSEEKEKK